MKMKLYLLKYNYYRKSEFAFDEIIGVYDSYEKLEAEIERLVATEKYTLFGKKYPYLKGDFEFESSLLLNETFIRQY